MPTISWPDILDKFLDNANLGKFVTDVGAGYLLAFPLLMLIGLGSGLSVFPIDRLRDLDERLQNARVELENREAAFCPDDPVCRRRSADDAKKYYGDAARGLGEVDATQSAIRTAYLAGSQRVAQSQVMLDALKDRLADRGATGGDAAALRDEYERRVTSLAQQAAQKAAVEEEAAIIERLEGELVDARSLDYNLTTITTNIGALLMFSVVLGVIVSQLSRFIFFNVLFDRQLGRDSPIAEIKKRLFRLRVGLHGVDRKEERPAPEGAKPAAAVVDTRDVMRTDPQVFVQSDTKRDFDDLVKNYYRYAEGAVNLIFPVLFTSVVLPFYLDTRAHIAHANAYYVASFVGGPAVALLLGLSGFNTYKSFVEKTTAVEKKATGAA